MTFLDFIYQSLCAGDKTLPMTVPGIVSRVLPAAIAVFVGMCLCLDFYFLVVKRALAKSNADDSPKQERKTTYVPPKDTSPAVAAAVFLVGIMLVLTCLFGYIAAIAIRQHSEEATAAMYTAFSHKFLLAGCLQIIAMTITAIWANVKETENTIRHTIIPAVYKTLSTNIETEDTVNRVFCIVCPIIDRYITGRDWNALINKAKRHPDVDGSSYLKQVLDVVYTIDDRGRSPYTCLFSESEQFAIDIIKVRVFHYPAYDTPWKA